MDKVRQALHTRRLYAWEREVMHVRRPLNVSLPMEVIHAWVDTIWLSEGRTKRKPRVVAGRGEFYNGRWLSFYQTTPGPRIVLARNQRNLGVVLHELAHALVGNRGYDHGPAFVECYLYLLERYGGFK